MSGPVFIISWVARDSLDRQKITLKPSRIPWTESLGISLHSTRRLVWLVFRAFSFITGLLGTRKQTCEFQWRAVYFSFSHNKIILRSTSCLWHGKQGWRSGESARLSPMSVARVWFPDPASYVGWVCCWFSTLLRKVFLWVLRFSSLPKNQHFQIPVRSWNARAFLKSSCELLGAPCVNKLHYITLHYITLHCIALHCIALHCITLHNI